MLSHYHADHALGFPVAAQTLRFQRAFDRAWPDCDDPCRISDYDRDGSLDAMRALYDALVERDGLVVEKFVEGRRDQVRMLHWRGGGVFDFQPVRQRAHGRREDGRDHQPLRGLSRLPARFFRRQWINENGMSLGMIVRYGAFSFLHGGRFLGQGADAGRRRAL
jgi:hypothetical protein